MLPGSKLEDSRVERDWFVATLADIFRRNRCVGMYLSLLLFFFIFFLKRDDTLERIFKKKKKKKYKHLASLNAERRRGTSIEASRKAPILMPRPPMHNASRYARGARLAWIKDARNLSLFRSKHRPLKKKSSSPLPPPLPSLPLTLYFNITR